MTLGKTDDHSITYWASGSDNPAFDGIAGAFNSASVAQNIVDCINDSASVDGAHNTQMGLHISASTNNIGGYEYVHITSSIAGAYNPKTNNEDKCT